jgi:peptidoglycan/LPS O-acetylase OafA/YrhL
MLRKKESLMRLFIFLIIILSGAQFAFVIIEKLQPFNFHSLFPRSYALTIGALAATYSNRIDLNHIILKNKYIEALLFILLFGLLCFEREYLMILLTPFISVVLILKTLNGNFAINFINKAMNNSKLQHIGLVSYGIYIFHGPLSHYLDHFIFNPIWNTLIPWEQFGALSKIEFHPYIIRLPLYFFLSYKLANVSYKYVESKILQYKIK